jgi:kynurenine formamidase
MIKKQIILGNRKFLVIDLTEPLSEQTQVYPGDPKPEKQVFSEINSGFEHYVHKISDHNFHPHADAPKHQNPEMQEKGIEYFNLDFCFNSALLIDLSEKGKENQGIKYLLKIEKHHLAPFSPLLKLKQAVVIRTGYDKYIEKSLYHKKQKIPYLTKEAADFLCEFNLKVIGIDSLSVDCSESQYVHKKFKKKMIVESLVHLYEIPEKEFFLQTSPVKILGATGGPVVAYAFIELK